MKKLNKLLGVFLALILTVSCVPTTVFAAVAEEAVGEEDYSISSLYILGGPAFNSPCVPEWLNGLDYVFSESNRMELIGDNYYKISFTNVPAGSSYSFDFVANEECGLHLSASDYHVTPGSEFSLSQYGSMITFDLNATANVTIYADLSEYDSATGTGAKAMLEIEYTGVRYAVECSSDLQPYSTNPDYLQYYYMEYIDGGYQYTFNNYPSDYSLSWCQVVLIDENGSVSNVGDKIYFKRDPNSNYYDYPTLKYSPDTNTPEISGEGLIIASEYALEFSSEFYYANSMYDSSDRYYYMRSNGGGYECTIDNIQYTQSMQWCRVVRVNPDSYMSTPESYPVSDKMYFKSEQNLYETPTLTVSYNPQTNLAEMSGTGIVTNGSFDFSEVSIISDIGSTGIETGYYPGNLYSEQLSSDGYVYPGNNRYCIMYHDVEPQMYPSNGYYNEYSDCYTFYFKTDSFDNPILKYSYYTAIGSPYPSSYSNLITNDGASSSSSYTALESSGGNMIYPMEEEMFRLRLATKSDIRIEIDFSNYNPQTGIGAILYVDICPTGSMCYIHGSEELISSLTGSGTIANNAMKYIGGMYIYHSGVLDDTDKIYYFAVAECSHMNQSVIWHGYNGQTYSEYSYNYYETPNNPTYTYQVLPIRFTINEPTYVAIFYDPTMNRVYINNNYDDKINILAPYEFSSLSVFPGRSSNDSSGRFLTIYPDSDDYVYQMEKQGDIYRCEFKNVPAGENYCFTLIADPNPNYQANIEYFCRSPYDSQFEFGGKWTPNIPTGASETRYDAEIAGSLIKFNLDINADVEIIFDASEYNEETGANGKITLKITPIKGDVNGDGIVDITDATALQMYLAQFEELTPAQQANADVDGDGYLTIKDVTMIQKYLANLIDSL